MSIFVGLFAEKFSWENQQIMTNLIKNKCNVIAVSPDELTFRFWKRRSVYLDEFNLAKLNGIYNRLDINDALKMPKYGFQALKYLEHAEVPIVNSPKSVSISHDKFESFLALDDKGIPVPKTILVKDLNQAEKMASKIPLPFVIKPVSGSWGRDTYLVHNLEDVHHNLENLSERAWYMDSGILLQEFVENPGRDIRVFVIGDEVVASMYRYAKEGEWRTNVALGAIGKNCEPNDEIKELSLKSVKAIGGDIMSVDLIEGPEGLRVLEVNGAADFKGLTESTGVNIAEKIVDYLVNQFKK